MNQHIIQMNLSSILISYLLLSPYVGESHFFGLLTLFFIKALVNIPYIGGLLLSEVISLLVLYVFKFA